MATPQMLVGSPRLDILQQQWSFQQAMLDAQKEMHNENNSDPPSPDMFSTSSTEDQIRIQSPDMKSIKNPILNFAAQKSTHVLHERYMSSDEQLSPMDSDSASSTGGLDQEDFADDEAEPDDWLEELFSEFTCKMATAICLIHAGKPRLVDIPVPSLTSSYTSSPSLSSEDGEKMPEHIFIPPRPKTPVRRRPVAAAHPPLLQSSLLRTKLPATTFVGVSTPNVVATYQPTSFPEHSLVDPRAVETYVPTAPQFLNIDPFAKSQPLIPPTHPPRISSHHTNHSRFRNLSQKLRLPFNGSKTDLGEFSSSSTATEFDPQRNKRKNSVASLYDVNDIISRARSGSVSLAPASLLPKVNKKLLPKMVPRGASERAPAIKIPPCPEDLDLNFDAPVHHPNKLKRRKSSILRF